MNITRVTLDFYNRSLGFNINGVEHLFSTTENFLEYTNFPADGVVIVSYELERNMFSVEYAGGIVVTGDQSPEIVWIHNNIDTILQAAEQDKANTFILPPITARSERDLRLHASDWVITRHYDETLAATTHTLSDEQLQELLTYRQQLRDMSAESLSYTDIQTVNWPPIPSFLA